MREQNLGIDNTTLTACAGIAFGRHNQPFGRLLELAEELCSFAKKHVKAGLGQGDTIPSAIAFYRQTTALIESDIDEILRREATNRQENWRLSAQPYLVGEIGKVGLFKLADLEDLKEWLAQEDVSRGRPRQLRKLLLHDVAAAKRDYRRWREILEKRGQLEAFDDLLCKFGIPEKAELPLTDKRRHAANMKVTPLFDALELFSLAPPEARTTGPVRTDSQKGEAA